MTLNLSMCFILNQFTHNKLIHVHLAGGKKPYIFIKMNEIYNYLRTDYVYSGIFIHNPTISLGTNSYSIFTILALLLEIYICIHSHIRSING